MELKIDGLNVLLLEEGWLASQPMDIRNLRIFNSANTKIREGTFSGLHSNHLKLLEIVSSEITTLQKKLFMGMGLNCFVFRSPTSTQRIEVEKRAMEGVQDTLQELEMHEYILGVESLQNLVGKEAAELDGVVKLDLSYNTIKVLPNSAFSNVRNSQQIFLMGSKIEFIEQSAFDSLYGLKQIFLNSNMLKTLPDGLFKGIRSLNEESIYLHDNPWVCDCSLLWLYKYMEDGKVNCQSPPMCNDGTLFVDEKDCEDDDHTSSPAPALPKTIKVTCGAPTRFRSNTSDDPSELTVVFDSLNLLIEELNDQELTLKYNESIAGSYFLWFKMQHSNKPQCTRLLHNNFVINNTIPATTYIFCLIPANESDDEIKVNQGQQVLSDLKDVFRFPHSTVSHGRLSQCGI